MKHLFKNSWLLFALWAISLSCNPPVNRNSDHEYLVNGIIDSANNLAESSKLPLAIFYLDSSFKTIPKPGIGDIWKSYYFKYRNYYWKGRGEKNDTALNKSMLYADSMQNLIIENNASKKYKNELSIAYFSKGDVLLEQENYRAAYQSYHAENY